MKVLFIFPYPLGRAPSQRFRFEQYLNMLTTKGVNYSCQSFWDVKAWNILYKRGYLFFKAWGLVNGFIKRIWLLLSIYQYDFVFIHRECLPVGPPIIEWIIGNLFCKKIIYDFDDAIWLPNTSSENKIVSFIKCHWKVKSICKWSYKVSCGNEYLSAFAKQFSQQGVNINPTTIDTADLHNPSHFPISKSSTSNIKIGWTGSHSTLKYLNLLVPVLQRLEVIYKNLRFLVIADKKPDLDINSLLFIPWNEQTEIRDLMQIDIGVMPLSSDQWALGKCGFKALQYMALNIPAVASPVGVNSKIIDHTLNGFLCDHEEEWFNHLCLLIEDKQLRMSMGVKARQKVVDHYSVSSNSSNFLSLFK